MRPAEPKQAKGGRIEFSFIRRPLTSLPVSLQAAVCPVLPSGGYRKPLLSHSSPSLQPGSQDPADDGRRKTWLSLTSDIRFRDHENTMEEVWKALDFSIVANGGFPFLCARGPGSALLPITALSCTPGWKLFRTGTWVGEDIQGSL